MLTVKINPISNPSDSKLWPATSLNRNILMAQFTNENPQHGQHQVKTRRGLHAPWSSGEDIRSRGSRRESRARPGSTKSVTTGTLSMAKEDAGDQQLFWQYLIGDVAVQKPLVPSTTIIVHMTPILETPSIADSPNPASIYRAVPLCGGATATYPRILKEHA
ncbi:uncharacterized protein EI97DRAFT_431354 [Westerdykella ornata]|uniref:Uncharacterized protein n=1 Tax=Westerdykella ornata TaxID=318751 RepID=A0A6A6JR87_WESOR|nr:uncharacterized protein EI97DRAFT_431354 [Westerdykella ornata]KAF2279151.1 hypothetical protein EI97DRAFT_431354 [Westerdykella ornata]